MKQVEIPYEELEQVFIKELSKLGSEGLYQRGILATSEGDHVTARRMRLIAARARGEVSTYKKRKKARKAREKKKREAREDGVPFGTTTIGPDGLEELYSMEIDLRTSTHMMCFVIDKGAGEYITNVSNNWDMENWAFLVLQMNDMITNFDKFVKFVLEREDLVLEPGTLFPEGVG